MNAQKPKSPPNKPLTDGPLNAVEQQLSSVMMHALQLERTIWLLAREAGGSMVIDEASVNPLWDLKYERGEGNKTLLKISAVELQEPSDTQIKKLADLLADQPEARTPSALLECGMSNFPAGYVVARLGPLVQCLDGIWKRT